MRTFCLLLILANALFFAWAQLIDVRTGALDRMPSRASAEVPRLMLAGEAKAADAAPEAEAPARVRPPSVAPLASSSEGASIAAARGDPLSCTTVGPFSELSAASQAQAALSAAGFEPRQRVVEGEVWLGYWVSVQGLATRAEVDSASQALRDNGIVDVYVMPASGSSQILSLGLFTDYQRALRRAAQVRELGFSPRIDDRTRAGSVYWIDVELDEPGQAIDSSLFQADPRKITRLEMRACPPAGRG